MDATSDAGARPPVSNHVSRPGRSVFTEKGNSDGWIASDVVVDVRP